MRRKSSKENNDDKNDKAKKKMLQMWSSKSSHRRMPKLLENHNQEPSQRIMEYNDEEGEERLRNEKCFMAKAIQ
ncbi:hypothetical protein Tco_0505616 [Tanacetum coccineum]